MKTRHSKYIFIMSLMTVGLALAFQNLAFIDWNEASLAPVNESIRIAHARELLGNKYSGSVAQKAEKIVSLNKILYRQVRTRLADSNKKLASEITKSVIEESSEKHFDPVFVMAIIETESKFNPKVVGSFGEIGLMQIKPDTAKWIADKYHITYHGKKDLFHPATNIKIGIAYMSYLRGEFKASSYKYLSAYNMGARNVKKLLSKNQKPKDYSLRVIGNYRQFYTTLAGSQIAQVASLD